MLVALLAFFSRISDPIIGGTYMTLLNTVANMGTAWTTTLSLSMVEWLTFKSCSSKTKNDCSAENSEVKIVDDKKLYFFLFY